MSATQATQCHRRKNSLSLSLSAVLVSCTLLANYAAADADPVVLTFSTVGDSRQDDTSPDPTQLPLSGQDTKWLQNTKAWSRIMRTIQTQKSNMLFFNGDMIMGYGKAALPATMPTTPTSYIFGTDLGKFYVQYAFWRGMVAPLMETGTYVVPVPGNHEVQQKKPTKAAKVENESAWRDNMGDLILDTTRFQNLLGTAAQNFDVTNNPSNPTTAATDGITTDQSQLSYSFDVGTSHFVVINTDPVGNDAHAPVTWLTNDLANAQTHGAQHYFVFGHKPAYTYYYGAGVSAPLPAAPAGLDNNIANRDAFWALIEQYKATYFCGHEHIFNAAQPALASGGHAWQVLVGSGGSPFEAKPADVTVNPNTDRRYAWATVKIHQSGIVNIDAYGFSDAYGPTQLIQSITLAQ